VKGWLEITAPQTDEYRALSQAHLHYLQLAAKPQPQPSDGKPISRQRDKAIPLVEAGAEANGLIRALVRHDLLAASTLSAVTPIIEGVAGRPSVSTVDPASLGRSARKASAPPSRMRDGRRA